ncbi:uncharacterized protein LOC133835929 [Drosophila sulfurigaster albostrigata]|uniref:uncharacterized protein LOC133835929 n=1 Tax=Drosophila sulfurigaster albostrigata TaxID=89887 RepID=UPI002D219FF3|nr:uncharacterized protein LOC133835929 [Drosophila sulfurigaster albostrigata]
MEVNLTTTATPELLHPEDAEYIWLPFLVLVGVVILAGLVYAMSRIRCSYNCLHFKRRNIATRNGYTNVDEEDSDVSMMGAENDEIGERNSITYLLDARLHISPGNQQTVARDVAVLA